MKAENEARFRAETEGGEIVLTGTHKADPRRVRARVRRDDVRRHPVGGHGSLAARPGGGGSRR